MKRITSLLLVLSLVLAMSVQVFAVDSASASEQAAEIISAECENCSPSIYSNAEGIYSTINKPKEDAVYYIGENIPVSVTLNDLNSNYYTVFLLINENDDGIWSDYTFDKNTTYKLSIPTKDFSAGIYAFGSGVGYHDGNKYNLVEYCMTIFSVRKLKAPTAKAASSSATSVRVSWKKVPGASGYVIYRATSKSGKYSKIKTITDGSIISYNNTGLTAGKAYYYKVRAYRSAIKDNTIYSSYSSIVGAKPVPAKVVISSLANVKGKKAVIKWGKVSGASGYVIYRAASKTGTYKAIKNITKGSIVSYTNTKLKKGKAYYYKIRAYRTVSGKKVYGSYSAIKGVKITK